MRVEGITNALTTMNETTIGKLLKIGGAPTCWMDGGHVEYLRQGLPFLAGNAHPLAYIVILV